MKDARLANMYRRHANGAEESAARWLAFAKNKKHDKKCRMAAARHYRENKREAADKRALADLYS